MMSKKELRTEPFCFLFKSFLFYLISIQFFITSKLKKKKKTLHKAEISKKTKNKTKTKQKKQTKKPGEKSEK